MPMSDSVNRDFQIRRTVQYTGYSADVTGSTAGAVSGTGNLGAAPTAINADLKPGACLQLCAGSTLNSPIKIAGAAAGSDVGPNDGGSAGQPILGMRTPFGVVCEDWDVFQQNTCNTLEGVTANLRKGGRVPINSSQTCKALCIGTGTAGVTLLEPVTAQFYLQPCSQRGSALLSSAVADSTAISNTASETAFSLTYTIPANTLQVGDVLHIVAAGSCVTNSTDTLVIKLYIGTQEVIATGTIDAATGDGFEIDCFVTIRTIGTAGTYVAAGMTAIETPSAAAGAADIPSFDYLGSTAINTTTTNAISVKATFNAASTSSTTTLQQLIVEKIGASNMGMGPIAVAMESFANASTAALQVVRMLNPPT